MALVQGFTLEMIERLITWALEMAIEQRHIQLGLVIHSDRGVQYQATRYQSLIRRNGREPSNSAQGNCWDNATMESFFSDAKLSWSMQSGFYPLMKPRPAYSSISKYSISEFDVTQH